MVSNYKDHPPYSTISPIKENKIFQTKIGGLKISYLSNEYIKLDKYYIFHKTKCKIIIITSK
jgi:hypothetical protein